MRVAFEVLGLIPGQIGGMEAYVRNLFRDSFTDYAHWDWLPYVHNDGGDVMTEDLTAQNLDPAAAAATQYLADMKLVHGVSPEAGAYDWYTGNHPLFESGRIAILMDEYPQVERGSWKQPAFYEILRRGIRWGIRAPLEAA